MTFQDYATWLIVPALLIAAFVLSTLIVRLGIPALGKRDIETKSLTPDDSLEHLIAQGRLPESTEKGRIFDWGSTGIWIGLCETILIFTFIFAEAYSALAIIIGAKQFVRSEQIKLAPSYYLLGTLANLTVAVLFALLARAVVTHSFA